MARYLLRRVTYLLPVWLGITFVAYSLSTLTPGDPAEIKLLRELGRPPTSQEVAQERENLGLDSPFAVRYVRWVGNALTGDLGTSFVTGEPVLKALATRFPASLQLALLGMVFALAVALPLGIMAAVWRDSTLDHLSRIVALLGTSMPNYWLAYLLILVFSVHLKVLPVAGQGSWLHVIMPSVTLGLAGIGTLMRLTRSEMLEVLGQDYIRTSRAKGLAARSVILGHALRNALIPVVTISGTRFAGLLGGVVIVETIFAWPGIGRLVVAAIFNRDYPIVLGFVVFMGTVYLLINLLVDLSYAWLDPRIRLDE